MKKRFLCLLLILVMTLSLLPTAVLADEPVTNYFITVFSPDGSKKEDITSANCTDVMDDGKVSYDPESNVLTLEDAHLGSIHANGYDLTLNLVGNNDIIPLSSNATAIIARGLSVQGTGSLHIKTTNAAAITLLDTSLYRQSGGNVTLEGDVIWQDASGIELTGGTLTLGGAGLQRLPAKLDAPDGTKVALFDANGTDAGSWVLPNEAWKTTIAIAAKMVLTAPATIDEASLAALKEGQTYYFDLSGVGIPGDVDERLPDKSLCYVPFTYAGKLEDVYRVKRTEEGLVDESGSWPLFIAGFDVSKVSWDDLNKKGLIYGESYTSNGVSYTLRAPSGNNTKNEWDAMCSRNIINRSPSSAWVQETPADAMAYYRDSSLSSGLPMHRDDSTIHYRPVLQPTNLYGKALRVVTLVVNGTSYNVITAEDTITPPSIDGLLNDGDELKNGYYWLNETNSKYYSSSERIPVTENMTLTAVPRGYGIIITDKDGKEHLVTKDNYTDVLDDGTVSYNPDDDSTGISGSKGVLTLKDAELQGVEYQDSSLALKLEGSSRIDAKGNANAIRADGLTIQGEGRLSVSVEDGHAITLPPHLFYVQNGGHVTLPESVLTTSGKLKFNGGTLTLLGKENGAFTDLGKLENGQIADGTELRLVDENGETRFSRETPLVMEEWASLEVQALYAKKLHLIADGATLPPEVVEPEEPEKPEVPSMEGVIAAGMALLASGDDNPFRDVRAIDWFYADVMYAYDRGLIRGTAYNEFSPKDTFTRGMLLTILARHDGVRTKDSTPWYASGCDWAARNGISDGKNPEEAVSREEFALILYRYAQYRGSNLLSGNDLSSFTDASAVSDAALPAVQWAASEAILRGNNFYLHPQDGATRAEAAAMLHRFFTR